MKSKKNIVLLGTFLVICVAFLIIVTGNSIPMENLLQNDYEKLSINQNVASLNQSIEITDKVKITKFQSIIQEISLIEIKPQDFQKIDKTKDTNCGTM
jgi:hypothetical protein